MKKFLYLLIIFSACNTKDNISDKSKHNEGWVWYIENGEQDGNWFKVSETGSYNFDNGKIVRWYNNGIKSSEGSVVNGIETVRWLNWHPNGKVKDELLYSGDTLNQKSWFENGKKRLIGTSVRPKEKKLWSEAKAIGKWSEWYENGQLRREVIYNNDTEIHKHWYENGQMFAEGRLYKNKVEGKSVRWYESGQIKDSTFWRNGKQEGPSILFHDNGVIAEKSSFKNGVGDGNVTLFYRNGKIKQEGQKEFGKAVGVWKFNNEGGKTDSVINYSTGLRIK